MYNMYTTKKMIHIKNTITFKCFKALYTNYNRVLHLQFSTT